MKKIISILDKAPDFLTNETARDHQFHFLLPHLIQRYIHPLLLNEKDGFDVLKNNFDQFEYDKSYYIDTKKNRVSIDDIQSFSDKFVKKGGQIIFVPHDFSEAQKNPFKIYPTDYLKPICHAGRNRSQVLRLILKGLLKKSQRNNPNADGKVFRAYGALSGIDPLNKKKSWYMKPTNKDIPFEKAFGQIKKVRFGEDDPNIQPFIGQKVANKESVLKNIRRFFKFNYFHIDEKDRNRRHIFFAFKSSIGVVLKRLEASNISLKNVILVTLPYEDDIHHPEMLLDFIKREKLTKLSDEEMDQMQSKQKYKRLLDDGTIHQAYFGKYASLFRY